MVWFKEYTIPEIEKLSSQTLSEHIGIKVIEIGENFLKATMPVDNRTIQPAGILHGGASVVLAETLASVGANLIIDPIKYACVGLEINANHVSAGKFGEVEGISKVVHIGKSTQIWETRITQGERLVCLSRMTVAILKKT